MNFPMSSLFRTARGDRRAAARTGSRRTRLRVEPLEGRQLLTAFTVSNTNDSGPGSLRQAIIGSNATNLVTPNTINFAIGTGTKTIAPLSALPAITRPVVLDGTTQPGTGAAPRIVLDGTGAGGASPSGSTSRRPASRSRAWPSTPSPGAGWSWKGLAAPRSRAITSA